MKPKGKTYEEKQCWQTCDVSITATATTFTPSALLLLFNMVVNKAKSEDI